MEVRGLEPNEIARGCMMDDFACIRCTSEAVELLRRWRDNLGSRRVIEDSGRPPRRREARGLSAGWRSGARGLLDLTAKLWDVESG